jgi:hypothetical protein
MWLTSLLNVQDVDTGNASTTVDDLHPTCAGGNSASGVHSFFTMQGKSIMKLWC